MKLDDYIRGNRHGREAHKLELEAMRDPLLSDAMDGFDAVPTVSGDHSAAFERLAEKIRSSAANGRAAARSHRSHFRERRIRSWSVAAAAVFLAAVAGGGVWLLRNEVPRDDQSAIAQKTDRNRYNTSEAEAILPPVTIVENETAPAAPANDMSDIKFDRSEVPTLSGGIAAMESSEETFAKTIAAEPAVAVTRATETVTEPARDTVITTTFRQYVHNRNIVRSALSGRVTLSFEIDADGRPHNVEVVESSAPELADQAMALLAEGPDWPTEPSRKLITLNL